MNEEKKEFVVIEKKTLEQYVNFFNMPINEFIKIRPSHIMDLYNGVKNNVVDVELWLKQNDYTKLEKPKKDAK